MDAGPLAGWEREWDALAGGRLRAALRRWEGSEPLLARFEDPGRLVAFLWDERGSSAEKDGVLLALLRLARVDPLAGRVVVQAMLPGLKGLGARLLRPLPGRDGRVFGRDELWQVLFCSLFERVGSYPLERRPRKVAANLLLDTLHAAVAAQKREAAARWQLPLEGLDEEALLEPEEEAFGEPVDVEGPLRRAVAAGAIGFEEAELVLATEVDGQSLSEAAVRLGVSYDVVKVRRQRAEHRVLVFLNGEAEVPYVRVDPSGRSKRPSSGAHAPERPHTEEFPLMELAGLATSEGQPTPGRGGAVGGGAGRSAAGGSAAVVAGVDTEAGAAAAGAEPPAADAAAAGSPSLA